MTPSEIKRIASGLSEAQRAAVVGNGGDMTAEQFVQLQGKGILSLRFERLGIKAHFTELGLAVRQHLKENSDG